MCGNGGRCISTAFLEHVGSRNKTELKFSFNTDIYSSSLNREKNWISLEMQNVNSVEMDDVAFVLDTGSPHYVTFLEDVNDLDVREMGSEIRNNLKYQTHGINVNFCSWNDNLLHVRTYERGVEDETYSCGTGVVASAISLSLQESFRDDDFSIKIKTLGGELAVRFTKKDSSFYNIKLEGPTVKVYQGIYFVQ